MLSFLLRSVSSMCFLLLFLSLFLSLFSFPLCILIPSGNGSALLHYNIRMNAICMFDRSKEIDFWNVTKNHILPLLHHNFSHFSTCSCPLFLSLCHCVSYSFTRFIRLSLCVFVCISVCVCKCVNLQSTC